MKVWPFKSRKPRSIGLQLLLTVNLLLSILLCGLMFWQYQEKMEQAVREKRSSLTDEAIAVHTAVAHLSASHGASSVQRYIDTVCQQMRNAWSPHHHIVVRLSGTVLSDSHTQTGACLQRANTGLTEQRNAADVVRSASHVSGRHSDDGISVVISETSDSIRRASREEVLTQLGIFGALGALATVLVNVILLRIVESPLKKLLAVVEHISEGQLGTQAPQFHTREMQQLASGINSMSRVLFENKKEQRLQMQKAREIQQHLLPKGVKLPHLETAHVFEPAEDVAGDYYDFLPLSDGSWLICLADVTGHGVPAAMGAAMLKTLLLAESEVQSFDLLTTLRNINRRFVEAILPGNFASMFLGRWNPATLEMTYASAGHEPAILLRASDRIEELESTGLLLGIDLDAQWEQQTVHLSHTDRVLLFSDGATESQDIDGQLFGRNQLTKLLAANSGCCTSLAVTNVSREISEYRGDSPPHDDLTLVLLACDSSPTESICKASNRYSTNDQVHHFLQGHKNPI